MHLLILVFDPRGTLQEPEDEEVGYYDSLQHRASESLTKFWRHYNFDKEAQKYLQNLRHRTPKRLLY
ncbi:MAG: hypothetical protein B7Y25_07435 [Alphaproteobacteria bacterium 16-39-46]|nr:MAG: hypothetical protein B7Y25_07435 [Alphaproteobacteria bacterium 16-39-46]OZA41751.1 MAG: hypothetical protein B7X84_07485 [Alphaproteobacteria bacterium 17-39-52]HQS84744.1 hypothetical protein [Alphaproteobacteria bacterium]HQS94560.1 hypothetical protein [Alphaproteobacteria bacterium]